MAHIKATEGDRAVALRLQGVRRELFGIRGQSAMASFLGVAQPTYSAYENAQVRLPHWAMQKLALEKGVDPYWLLTGRGTKFLHNRNRGLVVAEAAAVYGEGAVRVPVFESVGAGSPREINALEPVEHLNLIERFAGPGMVALRVKGNSMETVIPDGSLVGVDTQKRTPHDLQPGKIFVLWVRDEGMVIRRLYIYGKDLYFQPDNPAGNRPYIYSPLKRGGRGVCEEPAVQGRVEWVLIQL